MDVMPINTFNYQEKCKHVAAIIDKYQHMHFFTFNTVLV